MGFFKRGDDVLDLTDLQRRGLLRKAEAIEQRLGSQAQSGFVDFTGASQSSSSSSETSSGSSGSQFDFLDALAGVGGSSSSPTSSVGVSSGADSLEVQGLKNKIEDLEYKMRVLEDKIARLESGS